MPVRDLRNKSIPNVHVCESCQTIEKPKARGLLPSLAGGDWSPWGGMMEAAKGMPDRLLCQKLPNSKLNVAAGIGNLYSTIRHQHKPQQSSRDGALVSPCRLPA